MSQDNQKPDLSGFDMIQIQLAVQFEFNKRAGACLDLVCRTVGMLTAIADMVKHLDPMTALLIHEKAEELRQLEKTVSSSLFTSRRAVKAPTPRHSVTRVRKGGA